MASSAFAGAKILNNPSVWASVAIAIAVATGVASTASLEVPPEIDHYRDMGAAQALLDGRFGEDPAFLGETAWYPPLLPALMAVAALLFSQPLPWVYVHVGPILNAAAPLAFYFLARHLAPRWTAVYSLVAFLFLANWQTDTWMLASYSPWAWPVLFAQTFFYLALRTWLTASQGNGPLRWVAAGMLIGLTFLAHPAPAVLLVVITLVTTVARALDTPTDRLAAVRGLLVTGSAAALICAPFLLPLILRYGMNTENPIPGRYGGVWMGSFLQSQLSLRTLGAMCGGAWLLSKWHATDRPPWRWAILGGVAASLGGIAYGMLTQKLEPSGVMLPMLFPTFHFQFYLHALEALLFGPGLAWVMGVAVSWSGLDEAWRRFVPQVACLVLALVGLPGFLSRYDYTRWPGESRRFEKERRMWTLYDWAKRELEPNDVVLADTRTSMFAIVASGHAIVTTFPTMMNPYVALEPRERARDAMFDGLRAGDVDGFLSHARQFNVTHVIAEQSDEACCWLDAATVKTLPVVFDAGEAKVFAVPRP